MLFGVYAATAIHLFFLSVVSFLTDDLVQSPFFQRSKGFIFHSTKEWRSTIRTQPSLPPYLKKRRDNKSNTMVLPTQRHWGNISQQTHLPPSVESAIHFSCLLNIGRKKPLEPWIYLHQRVHDGQPDPSHHLSKFSEKYELIDQNPSNGISEKLPAYFLSLFLCNQPVLWIKQFLEHPKTPFVFWHSWHSQMWATTGNYWTLIKQRIFAPQNVRVNGDHQKYFEVCN